MDNVIRGLYFSGWNVKNANFTHYWYVLCRIETSLNGVYVVYDKAGMFTFNLKHTNNLKMSKKLQEDISKTPKFDVLNAA